MSVAKEWIALIEWTSIEDSVTKDNSKYNFGNLVAIYSFGSWMAHTANRRQLPFKIAKGRVRRTALLCSPYRRSGFPEINQETFRIKSFRFIDGIVYSYWRDIRFVWFVELVFCIWESDFRLWAWPYSSDAHRQGLFGIAPANQLLTIVLMHLQMRILRRMNLCSSFVVCNACLEIRKIFHLFSREPVSTLRLLYESQPPWRNGVPSGWLIE